MFCPKCGAENADDAQLCKSCSWVLASVSITAQNPDAKTSALAVTALVLVILMPFTLFVTMIPALIFGIIGLVKIEKSSGRLRGKGLAIAGIAAPAAILLFIVPLMIGIMMPALSRVRGIAKRMVCLNNMQQLGMAMILYTDKFDGRYPVSDKWCDLLIEQRDVNEPAFHCPAACEGRCNYAMNSFVERLGRDAPADMVLLFESAPGWNQAGGAELLCLDNHNGEGCNVVFCDGHVRFVVAQDVNELRWDTSSP